MGLVEPIEGGHRREALGAQRLGHHGRRDVLDDAFAAVEPLDPLGVDVEAQDVEAGPHRRQGERKADIAETDDADRGVMTTDDLAKLGGLAGWFVAVRHPWVIQN